MAVPYEPRSTGTDATGRAAYLTGCSCNLSEELTRRDARGEDIFLDFTGVNNNNTVHGKINIMRCCTLYYYVM